MINLREQEKYVVLSQDIYIINIVSSVNTIYTSMQNVLRTKLKIEYHKMHRTANVTKCVNKVFFFYL